jgi:hypothetical protein
MLWDQLVGMVDLKTTMDPGQTPSLIGWTLIHADGISADGSVIAGWGENPMDEKEAFIAREVVASKPIDFEKTQSHIICCWQPPGPDPWIRVFDGSASGTTPECAPIVSYEWDFGDGEKGAGEIGRHRFTRAGTHRVQLTVRDACRGVATDFVEVQIGQQ